MPQFISFLETRPPRALRSIFPRGQSTLTRGGANAIISRLNFAARARGRAAFSTPEIEQTTRRLTAVSFRHDGNRPPARTTVSRCGADGTRCSSLLLFHEVGVFRPGDEGHGRAQRENRRRARGSRGGGSRREAGARRLQ